MHLRPTLKTLALTTALTLPLCTLAQGMGNMNMGSNTKSDMKMGGMVSPAHIFDSTLSGEESEIVSLAEAMPADKFNFAPSSSMGKFDGVRTFSAQIKHITEANFGFFDGWGISGAKSRSDLDGATSREQILQNLKDSFAYAHKAMQTITAQNAFVDMNGKGGTRAGTAVHALAHMNDHYGQMVEYLRMNGMVPPASQR